MRLAGNELIALLLIHIETLLVINQPLNSYYTVIDVHTHLDSLPPALALFFPQTHTHTNSHLSTVS